MKKTLLILATALAIPLAMADAPSAPTPDFAGPGPQRGANVDRMARVLDLTHEQQDKLNALQAEQQERRQAMRAEHQARIQAILTPAQYEKWSDLRQMRHERMAHRMGGMGGMGGCDGTGPRGWR